MKIGVPKEIKVHEYRIALTPEGVSELVRAGHNVVVEKNAGVGSAIEDTAFIAAGAVIEEDVEKLWREAEMILKVKEPIAPEYSRIQKNQILFTYLHLAASKECTDALIKSQCTAIAYETVSVNGYLRPRYKNQPVDAAYSWVEFLVLLLQKLLLLEGEARV
jgi:alanine dehydrogenase